MQPSVHGYGISLSQEKRNRLYILERNYHKINNWLIYMLFVDVLLKRIERDYSYDK